jgi:nicotinamidase/pyrazinamidase
MKSALIVVDVQNDFLPGGALAVREGDQVVPIANRLMASSRFDLIVATQDWHPANHGSFAANHAGKQPGQVTDLDGLPQILWPVHCVQNTAGADFAPGLDTKRFERVFRKGTDPKIDSYSGFFDNGHRKSTGLGEWLKGDGATDIYVIGLATDYCVKFTALDGVKLKFKVHLIPAACRGVELRPGDIAAAIEEMKAAGVQMEGVS